MTQRHVDEDVLTEFVWGELDPVAARTVVEHLAHCPDCRAKVESLRRAQEGLRSLAEEPVEDVPSVWPAVRRRLRRPRHLLWWPAAAAAALALWLLLRSERPAEKARMPDNGFQVLQAEVAGRPAHVFVFTPSDSVTTVWLE